MYAISVNFVSAYSNNGEESPKTSDVLWEVQQKGRPRTSTERTAWRAANSGQRLHSLQINLEIVKFPLCTADSGVGGDAAIYTLTKRALVFYPYQSDISVPASAATSSNNPVHRLARNSPKLRSGRARSNRINCHSK
jgi:hypothetical protein